LASGKTGQTDLKALSKQGVVDFVEGLGLPRYRAGQLLHWMYSRNAESLTEITEFSLALRADLAERACISNLALLQRLQSDDGTEKYLFGLEDGSMIESVLIPDEGRLTLCISSQVGCAMGCLFCQTGKMGLTRNLRSHEIVDQIVAANRMLAPERRVTNIVLMGMGEPLANFGEVVDALWRITDLLGISKRRITLSTSGVVPRMAELPARAPEVNLAVSLNATTDQSRSLLMPVNKRYPLNSLLEACRRYPLSPRRRITFEYVLVGGINDSPEDARRLAGLLKKIRCKVNLIPLNPAKGENLRPPSEKSVLEFQEILLTGNITALIRKSKGRDILAACGQLRAAREG
jgi:23S rRNA (adenine2503-C2)-methyltransferase